MIRHFTIRIYALILNEKQEVLLSDEYFRGEVTKFPGGGMEFGEGPYECLRRESLEEFGQELEITEHFYTTDFFQKAMHRENAQVFSVYYFARFKEPVSFKISTKPFDAEIIKPGNISFRFEPIDKNLPNKLSWPIDKKVAKLLVEKFGCN